MFTRRSKTTCLILAALAAGLAFTAPAPSAPSDSPLAPTLDAHGGLDRWLGMGRMTYELDGFPLSPQVAEPNRSTVDLRTRRNLIESEGFTVGFDGQDAWSTPGPDAVGLPPRFFTLGSFYFHGMPFVFADPGVILEELDTTEFNGRLYRAVRLRYEDGVGHSADDDYVLFIDPDTDRLALIHHSVTEIGVDRVTWTFDEWQRVDGLLVPARMTYYKGWNPDEPGEGASYTIENVTFATAAPAADFYAAPEGAVIAE